MNRPVQEKTFRSVIDSGPMSGYQWGSVGLCNLLNIIDGFDILVIAFTATGITRQWNLPASMLGLLLSSGLVGMALGTLFVAPWADRIGRRPTVLICLFVVGIGMIGAAMSTSPLQLGVIRIFSGLGMGGIIVCANVAASEFSSRRWRNLAVSLNNTGYALGASLGGVVAVAIQHTYSWRAVFVFGAILTLAVNLAVLVLMPESPDFLASSSRSSATARLARIMTRMGFDPDRSTASHRERPERSAEGPSRGFPSRAWRVRALLSGEHRPALIAMCSTFFLTMFGYYFVQSWTPRLLVLAGMSETQANVSGTLLNMGGLVGSIFIGLLAARRSVRTVLVFFQFTAAVLLCLFAAVIGSAAGALVTATLIGLVVNGCMAGMFALCTVLFPADIRATAVGLATSVGRLGAIVAPAIVGELVGLSWSSAMIYIVMAVVFVGASGVLSRVRSDAGEPPERLAQS